MTDVTFKQVVKLWLLVIIKRRKTLFPLHVDILAI